MARFRRGGRRRFGGRGRGRVRRRGRGRGFKMRGARRGMRGGIRM